MFSAKKQFSVRKILSFSARNLANHHYRDDFVLRMEIVYVGNIYLEKKDHRMDKLKIK